LSSIVVNRECLAMGLDDPILNS